jgi:hypothetical protein
MDFTLLPAVNERISQARELRDTVRETANTVRDVAGTVRQNPRGAALTALNTDPATRVVTQAAQQATTLLASPAQTQEEQDEREESRESSVRVRLPEMKAKLQALPEGVREKAIMLRASTELKKTSSTSAAQDIIDRHSPLRGWRVDTELSNSSSLVLSKGGNVKIAYRGTEGLNASDWHHNARTAVGTEAGSPQMKQAIAQFDSVRAKYGRAPSELLGYSRGGNLAMTLGDLRNVKTTTFNPFVSAGQIKAN